jgi:hypothetical protein
MAQMAPAVDPATKLRTVLAMADGGVAMKRESLRRLHPEANEDDLENMIHAWLGERLASDGPGLPGVWPRRRR